MTPDASAQAAIHAPKPALVVVSGAPGSGKSTLARALADAIHCPMVSRDQVFEGLRHTWTDESAYPGNAAAVANGAFFACVNALLQAGVSVVIEAAFQHRLWAPALGTLGPLADIRVVRCIIDPGLALRRMALRLQEQPWRLDVHQDAQYLDQKLRDAPTAAPFNHVALDVPTLDVDTTEAYSPALDVVVRFVQHAR